jgi:hypothetical protein
VRIKPTKKSNVERAKVFLRPKLSVNVVNKNIPEIEDTKTMVENTINVEAYSHRKSTPKSSASEWNGESSKY